MALVAVVMFAVLRAIGLFGGPTWRTLLPLSFLRMALLPWVLLDRDGRPFRSPRGGKWPRTLSIGGIPGEAGNQRRAR